MVCLNRQSWLRLEDIARLTGFVKEVRTSAEKSAQQYNQLVKKHGWENKTGETEIKWIRSSELGDAEEKKETYLSFPPKKLFM